MRRKSECKIVGVKGNPKELHYEEFYNLYSLHKGQLAVATAIGEVRNIQF
jgi:hypothetical protein